MVGYTVFCTVIFWVIFYFIEGQVPLVAMGGGVFSILASLLCESLNKIEILQARIDDLEAHILDIKGKIFTSE